MKFSLILFFVFCLSNISIAQDYPYSNMPDVFPGTKKLTWEGDLSIKMLDGAHRFIDYLLDAKVGAQLSNYINYATPNAAAMPRINEEARSNPRVYPPADQMKRLNYLEDVGDATGVYDEVWTAVKSR